MQGAAGGPGTQGGVGGPMGAATGTDPVGIELPDMSMCRPLPFTPLRLLTPFEYRNAISVLFGAETLARAGDGLFERRPQLTLEKLDNDANLNWLNAFPIADGFSRSAAAVAAALDPDDVFPECDGAPWVVAKPWLRTWACGFFVVPCARTRPKRSRRFSTNFSR